MIGEMRCIKYILRFQLAYLVLPNYTVYLWVDNNTGHFCLVLNVFCLFFSQKEKLFLVYTVKIF